MKTSRTGKAIYNISGGNGDVDLEVINRVGDYETVTVEDRYPNTYGSLKESYTSVNLRESTGIEKNANLGEREVKTTMTRSLKKRMCIGVITAEIMSIVLAVGIIAFLLWSSESEGNFEAGRRCPQYTDIENGNIVSTTGSNQGDVIEIECDERNKLVGSNLITCLSSGQWSAIPKCMPKNCGDFVIPNNMKIESDTNDSVVGMEIVVSCSEGFKLQGNKTMICTLAESRSIPTCKAIDCGVPGNISNSEVIGRYNSTYNNTFFVKCNEGYKLKGSNTIRCTESGVWDKFPTCDIVSCGLPKIPIHGSISNTTGTTFQATATIKCDDKLYLDGNSMIRCQADGFWTKGATCENKTNQNECLSGEMCVDLNEKGTITGHLNGVAVQTSPTSLLGGHECSRQALFKVTFEKLPTNSTGLCHEGEYSGRGMLKVQMFFSSANRYMWMFNIGDSQSNNGWAGDYSSMQYEAEIQGKGNHIDVYSNDVHLINCDARSLYHYGGATNTSAQKVNVWIANHYIKVANDNGLFERNCNKCLYGLNGQSDYGSTNQDIYVAANRVVYSNYRNGHGLCFLKMSWVNTPDE